MVRRGIVIDIRSNYLREFVQAVAQLSLYLKSANPAEKSIHKNVRLVYIKNSEDRGSSPVFLLYKRSSPHKSGEHFV